MGIPKYYEFYKPYLTAIVDGNSHSTKEINQFLCNSMNISQADLLERLPSGTQTVFANRVGWCKTYLKHAGCIEVPTRTTVRITAIGKKVYEDNTYIDNTVLSQFEGFKQFFGHPSEKTDSVQKSNQDSVKEKSETPQETIQRAYDSFQAELQAELLSIIQSKSPTWFEHLVVQLLEKMGYCEKLHGKGITTQPSNDGGIDGIVYQDRLGFDRIYIQAKKWQQDSTVSRPEIQKFYGAMAGQHATKGLFITTTQFSKAAEEYASNQSIILVDGEALAGLMIEYELGITTEYVYKMKRIDGDFFDEE